LCANPRTNYAATNPALSRRFRATARVESPPNGQENRKITIEPVFGQIKYNRHIDRFMRRGRAAAQSEWRLVTATHNLLKLHNHWTISTA
jgi:Transposase DDE domain